MQPHLQMEERVANPDERYRNSGNVHLDRLLGAVLHTFPEGEDEAAADASLEVLAATLREQGRRPYVIHLGIEHPPVGGLGYVAAASEIATQSEEMNLRFDAVVVASGSALTHAGLLVGLRALGLDLPVYGVCVRRNAVLQHQRVERRAREIAAMLQQHDLIHDRDLNLMDAVLAPGYGKMNAATWEAMQGAVRLEALFLDPVYTGKSMAGLMHLVRECVLPPGARILFIHTGGQPALFGYEAVLQDWMQPRSTDQTAP
jgi:D-cysteine desulfhydrase/L-cysteate sulfo-lyase